MPKKKKTGCGLLGSPQASSTSRAGPCNSLFLASRTQNDPPVARVQPRAAVLLKGLGGRDPLCFMVWTVALLALAVVPVMSPWAQEDSSASHGKWDLRLHATLSPAPRWDCGASLPFLPQVCDHAQEPRPENHAQVLHCLGLLGTEKRVQVPRGVLRTPLHRAQP